MPPQVSHCVNLKLIIHMCGFAPPARALITCIGQEDLHTAFQGRHILSLHTVYTPYKFEKKLFMHQNYLKSRYI